MIWAKFRIFFSKITFFGQISANFGPKLMKKRIFQKIPRVTVKAHHFPRRLDILSGSGSVSVFQRFQFTQISLNLDRVPPEKVLAKISHFFYTFLTLLLRFFLHFSYTSLTRFWRFFYTSLTLPWHFLDAFPTLFYAFFSQVKFSSCNLFMENTTNIQRFMIWV